MTFRPFSTGVFAACLAVSLSIATSAWGQAQPTPTPAPAAKANATPDYPDPRTPSIGLFYWVTAQGPQPHLYGGKLSTDYATLANLGKPKMTPGVEVNVPITRTDSLHFEYFRTKGDGNETLNRDADLFANQFYKNDYPATQYQIQAGKFYLDDLLWPHKFPVSRFRLKSLWGGQLVKILTTVDAPYARDINGNLTTNTGQGTRQIIFPSVGLAAEYALRPHLLFRAEAMGFGLPHKAEILDAQATLAYRRGRLEIVGGAKTFHFKTSPNNAEYLSDTIAGAFVGVRVHLF